MRRSLLIAALGGLLLVGPAASIAAAQGAVKPLAQPALEPAPPVKAEAAVLVTVRIPRASTADGKPLPAGSYQVRLTDQEAAGQAPGATAYLERYVEFVKGGKVVGREVASIVPSADIAKVAKGKPPAPGGAKVELLKGGDFLRVWINKGGNHYLTHLGVTSST
jgi:hypothetical protein